MKAIIDSQLNSAVALHELNPDTFLLPDLTNLRYGCFVKICVAGERFWCKVIEIIPAERRVTAIIDNDLDNSEEHGLSYRDTITIGLDNIYEIC